jgi:hypothetical protein
MKFHESPYINRRNKTIEFYVHHLNATSAAHISLAGSFQSLVARRAANAAGQGRLLEDLHSHVAEGQVLLQVFHR